MKLYYMPGACSLAANILLHEAGLVFTLEKVGRDKKTEHGDDFLALNPKGYVPALRMNDGEILTENVVLQNYIADLSPTSKLAPAHGTKARLRQDELAVYISTEIHKSYSPLFNPSLSDDAKKPFRDKVAQRYELIENLLSDGRTYLTGENFATVDAYLFTITRWGKALGIDFSKYPHVLVLQDRIEQRPAVRAALEAEGLKKPAS